MSDNNTSVDEVTENDVEETTKKSDLSQEFDAATTLLENCNSSSIQPYDDDSEKVKHLNVYEYKTQTGETIRLVGDWTDEEWQKYRMMCQIDKLATFMEHANANMSYMKTCLQKVTSDNNRLIRAINKLCSTLLQHDTDLKDVLKELE